MNRGFPRKSLACALALAFPVIHGMAAEPYPPLPPALSTAVPPNVVLYIDTSGSMLQDSNNQWMQTGLCNSNTTAWNWCVDNNWNGYRTAVDSEATTPNSKMNIAKRVMRNLVSNNRSLRFGVFTFQDNPNNIGGNERSQAAIKRVDVREVSTDAGLAAVQAAINGVYGRTGTPLAEGLFEITRYFEGKTSRYGLNGGAAYTSPIQYRCQKNFAIVVTDGDATGDQNLPGSGQSGEDGNGVIAAFSYTARDSAGAAVSKTFSVCTAANSTADDGYNVTCPSTYDSGGAPRSFGDSSNRPSALRDVAMYANRADLRVGGVDGDNRSFDDPQFALQNMITYTVGFATTNAVLPSVAKVGGGLYYSASNETDLANSLNSAISSIGDITSNAGGISVKGDTLTSGNLIFQPVFDPQGWFGELRCFVNNGILTESSGLGTACTPNAKAVIPDAASRYLYSSKVVGQVTTPFDFTTGAVTGSMTTAQKNALGTTDTERQNVVSFLRGSTVTAYRSRPYGLLGDIIDGKPVTVAAPSGESNDSSYASFKTSNASRGMVFIGANDGMLHGFRMSDMNEIVGYVPSAVYRNLKLLTDVNYGNSATAPHTYFVNGALRKADVKNGSNWMTLMVGGLGEGGQSYFALDVTNENTLKTNGTVKWEFSDIRDADLGYTFPAPLIYNVRTSANTVVPAVIMANGYENTYDDTASGGQKATAKSSVLYILNALTGELLTKITVPSSGSQPSQGLSSPAGVDVGQDGVLDYVYAGDINGNLWRFDLTKDTPAQFFVAPNPVFKAANGQPITIRPAIQAVTSSADNSDLGNLIMFGTGQLLVDADRSDKTVQSFYAVLDKMTSSVVTATKADLTQRTILDTEPVSGASYRAGNYRQISTSPTLDLRAPSNTSKGWYLDLPEETERLVTSPLLLTDRLVFGTGIPKAAEKCVPGGRGWIMGLNPLNGSVTESKTGRQYSFVDVKVDGKSTDDDKINFSGGKAFASGFEIDGIPTELTYVSKSVTSSAPAGVDSGLGNAGSAIALENVNYSAVFTGNAGGQSVTTGKPIARPESTGGGNYIVGLQGKPKVIPPGAPPSSSGVKVETTLWREIR